MADLQDIALTWALRCCEHLPRALLHHEATHALIPAAHKEADPCTAAHAAPEPPDAASTSLKLLLRRLMVRRALLTARDTLRGAVPRPRRPRPPRVGAGSS